MPNAQPDPEQFEMPFAASVTKPSNIIVAFTGPAVAPGVAEAIYAAYPHKVARPNAIAAIRKALRNHTAEYLMERTQRYAELRGDCKFEIPSVPHPATWFNQERFNDAEETWLPNDRPRPTPAKLAEIAAAKATPDLWEKFLIEFGGGKYVSHRGTERHAPSFMQKEFAAWRQAK